MYESAFNEKKGLGEKLDDITRKLDEQKTKKKPKFRIPWKAKVSNQKMKRKYATVLIIHENKSVEFTREPINDSVVKLQEGNEVTFHAIDSDDILVYKGKPFMILPKNKKNPYNPAKGDNETYGHKYILARMESEKLSLKKKMGWGLGIGGLIIAGIIGYSVLFGG